MIGPRTVEQAAGNLAGLTYDLSDEHRARLDAVFAPLNRPVTGMPIAVAA